MFHTYMHTHATTEQCHRGLCLLRTSTSLEHVRLEIGAPTARLLSAVGALQHMPRLKQFELIIDHRGLLFSIQHAKQVCLFERAQCGFHLEIHHAMFDPVTYPGWIRVWMQNDGESVRFIHRALNTHPNATVRIESDQVLRPRGQT